MYFHNNVLAIEVTFFIFTLRKLDNLDAMLDEVSINVAFFRIGV